MSFVKRQSEDSFVGYTCKFCNSPTASTTLSMFGARCARCYEVYCKEPTPARKYPDSIPNNSMAWAYRLKWRHEQGEELSEIQIEKYKQALRIE